MYLKVNTLSEQIENIKQDILVCTMKQLADRYYVSTDTMYSFVRSNNELLAISQSDERRKYLAKKRTYTKVDNRKHIGLFNKRLVEKSCINLAEAVVKLAVKEKDRYFFESGCFEFWQQLLPYKKNAQFYLDCMDEKS